MDENNKPVNTNKSEELKKIFENSAEITDRYGEASKQHIVAYTGVDNATGKTLKRSLKDVASYEDHNQFKTIHQQAGFSAEIKDVANVNANNIITKSDQRKMRYDDFDKENGTNHPLYDHIVVDGQGNILEDSHAQMKFVGASEKDPAGLGNASRSVKKFTEKKYEKYLENDVKIEVPSDYYADIIKETKAELKDAKKQLLNEQKLGKREAAAKTQKRIEKLEKIEKNVVESTVSSKEAVFAKKHPKLSTAQSMTKIAGKAGVENAMSNAKTSAQASSVRNTMEILKGHENIEDAAVNVVRDTGKSAAIGMGTGAVGATAKAFGKNMKPSKLKQLSAKVDTKGLGKIAGMVSATKSDFKEFQNGNIDTTEFAIRAVEDCIAVATSDLVYATVSAVAGEITAQVCLAVLDEITNTVLSARREYRYSKKQLKEIEKYKEYAIQKQKELQQKLSEYMKITNTMRDSAYKTLEEELQVAIVTNNIDNFYKSINSFGKMMGVDIQFESFEEMDDFMSNSQNAFVF